MTNEKPFDMPVAYYNDAQLAYSIHKFTARVYLNNLFDARRIPIRIIAEVISIRSIT